jgi:hypothetical protein
MKLRLMKVLLIGPCLIIDILSLWLVGIPLWIICGISIIDHQPLSMYLMELENK